MPIDEINRALELFNGNCYEECVEVLIEEYNKGIETEWIKEFFYQNFILPNEEEFRENYSKNTFELTSCKYEECLIDFIPVSEDKFYLFLRNEDRFLGSIDLNSFKAAEEKEFHSLLIADTWDLRDMLPFITKKEYQTVYIILEDLLCIFASFFKLKSITNKILYNAILFSNTEEMKTYFIEYPSYYLPHDICSLNNERYKTIISEIRKDRINNTCEKRDNVFLSICIPSYNRGNRALESIKNMQRLQYDAEIEFFVSDNASNENVDGYDEIRRLGETDSRITYSRLPENLLIHGNVCNIVDQASGRFLMFASDEDILIIENIEKCMNYLYRHMECGGGTFSHIGVNGGIDEERYASEAYLRTVLALNTNYLTGLVLNKTNIDIHGILSIIREYERNLFVRLYPHSAFMVLATAKEAVFNSELVMWEEGESEASWDYIVEVFQAPDRIRQAIDTVEFIRRQLDLPEDVFAKVIEERICKVFFLIGLAFSLYGKNEDANTWFQSCIVIYTGWEEYFDKLSLKENHIKQIRRTNILQFWEGFMSNPLREWMSAEESMRFQITAMIMQYMDAKGYELSKLNYKEIENGWIKTFI
ncbi:MAG: glycosyltransferase family 2 protein [Lachnospiraceae bacterium]|nr:glycosyltransferase family 2 protein [Lachnospiraceae bacterium]